MRVRTRLAWVLAGAAAARAGMSAAQYIAAASRTRTAASRTRTAASRTRTAPGSTDSYPSLFARSNYRGETVTLAEGVGAVSAHALAGAGLAGATGAAAFAVTGAVGLADDLLEPLLYREKCRAPKGLKGHLGALARGQVTTGNIKILGITACSGVLALLTAYPRGPRPAPTRGPALTRNPSLTRRPTVTRIGNVALDTVLIAASANLANLFDLRPGRAMKTVSAAHLLLTAATLITPRRLTEAHTGGITRFTSAHLGAMAALAADDLAGRGMLGDAGANVLGAAVGTRAATLLGTGGRLATTAVVLALTLASEKVSFSQVIAATPVLRAIDEWGRS